MDDDTTAPPAKPPEAHPVTPTDIHNAIVLEGLVAQHVIGNLDPRPTAMTVALTGMALIQQSFELIGVEPIGQNYMALDHICSEVRHQLRAAKQRMDEANELAGAQAAVAQMIEEN